MVGVVDFGRGQDWGVQMTFLIPTKQPSVRCESKRLDSAWGLFLMFLV